jgi:hypothetical protein
MPCPPDLSRTTMKPVCLSSLLRNPVSLSVPSTRHHGPDDSDTLTDGENVVEVQGVNRVD